MAQDGPKYPECEVQLTGEDTNAVALIMPVYRALIQYLTEGGMSRDEATKEAGAFRDEATSGDYNNVLATCVRWVSVV